MLVGRGCQGQIKYTAGPSWMSNPSICVNDVTVSMKLFLLKVEIWVEKQLWTLAPANSRTSTKEEFCYLKWPLQDEHGARACFLNTALEGQVQGLLLILLLINRFPVSQEHVRWSDFSWSWEGHISTCCFSVPLNEARFIMKRLPLNPEESRSNINNLTVTPPPPSPQVLWKFG